MINVTLDYHPPLWVGLDDTPWAGDDINGGGLNDFVMLGWTETWRVPLPYINVETIVCFDFFVPCDNIEYVIQPDNIVYCARR